MEARGEGGASLSGADPMHHSALHRFTRTSAAHFPSRDPTPSPPHLSPRPLPSWFACQSLVMFAMARLSSPPSPQLSFLRPVCLFFIFFPPCLDQALAVSPIWHVLMLTELLSSDNVTIS